jgi:hypothetical protein
MIRFLTALLLTWLTSGPTAASSPSMRTLSAEVEIHAAGPPPVPAGWIEIESPMARVYADSGDRPTALRLSRHIAARLPSLAAELKLPVGNRIHVVLAPSMESFRSLQPGKVPEWADGTAWPHRGWIFLRAPRLRGEATDPLETVLTHELVHVLLGRAFGPRPVPQWLQEGLAQLMAGEYSAETTATLANGVLGDNLLSLYELSRGFPRGALRAQLAYAQSADFVAYIRNTYGEQAIQTLIDEMARGEAFAPAIRIATGDLVDDIDTAWRSRLQDSPLQFAPLMNEGVWWAIGALLVPLAWFLVRRRNRRVVERWKREEVLEEALYRTLERQLDAWEETSEGDDEQSGPPIWPIQ